MSRRVKVVSKTKESGWVVAGYATNPRMIRVTKLTGTIIEIVANILQFMLATVTDLIYAYMTNL